MKIVLLYLNNARKFGKPEKNAVYLTQLKENNVKQKCKIVWLIYTRDVWIIENVFLLQIYKTTNDLAAFMIM